MLYIIPTSFNNSNNIKCFRIFWRNLFLKLSNWTVKWRARIGFPKMIKALSLHELELRKRPRISYNAELNRSLHTHLIIIWISIDTILAKQISVMFAPASITYALLPVLVKWLSLHVTVLNFVICSVKVQCISYIFLI